MDADVDRCADDEEQQPHVDQLEVVMVIRKMLIMRVVLVMMLRKTLIVVLMMNIHPKSKNVCGFCFSVQKCINSHNKISRQKCVNQRNSTYFLQKKGIHLLTALCQIIYCVFPPILKWHVRSETKNLLCMTF